MKGDQMDVMPHQPNSPIENAAMIVFIVGAICVFTPLLGRQKNSTVASSAAVPFPITIHESRPAPTPESPEGNADASQDATQPDGVPGRDLVRTTDIAVQTRPVASVLRRAPYEVTVYTQDWCLPCRDMKQRDGNGNADIRLTWVESKPPAGVPEVYPALCWRDRNGRLRYVNGALPLSLLQAIIERNDPPPREVLP